MQFHNITTKVDSIKSATAFGDIPDCWYVLKYQDSKPYVCLSAKSLSNLYD